MLTREKIAKIREIEATLAISPIRDTVANLGEIHPADVADWLNELDSDTFRKIMRNFPSNSHLAQILLHLSPDRNHEVLEIYTPYKIATLANCLESDDSNEILHKLSERRVRHVLRYLSKEKKLAFLSSTKHEKRTAGRLMVQNPITCSGDDTVKQLLSRLQKKIDLPETFLDVFVLDKNQNVAGIVSIGKIVASDSKKKLIKVANRVEHIFKVDTPVEDIIESFQQYNTITAPVVDSKGKVVGCITVDEVLDWADEEGEQRAPKMFGVDVEKAEETRTAIAKRFIWLTLNLAMAVSIGWTVSLFESEIAKVAIIVALMPMVASMSGTATCQSASIMIRCLGTGPIKKNSLRQGWKEIYLSCINGVGFGVITFAFISIWRSFDIGLIAGISILLSMIIAGLAGVAVPLILAKMRLDPAVGSSIVITSITDAVSFMLVIAGATILILHQ